MANREKSISLDMSKLRESAYIEGINSNISQTINRKIALYSNGETKCRIVNNKIHVVIFDDIDYAILNLFFKKKADCLEKKPQYSSYLITIEFQIQFDNDYKHFFASCVTSDSLKMRLKDIGIVFTTKYNINDKINELLLHNYILIRNYFSEDLKEEKISMQYSIEKDYDSKKALNSDFFRLLTYMSLLDNYNEDIYLNGTPLSNPKPKSIGALYPAISLNAETFSVLSYPIDHDKWKLITNSEIIDDSFGTLGKYWQLYRACQRYLFEDFAENTCKAYTELRCLLFQNDSFYNEYISRMPFLALLLFAQFDFFFRSSVLRRYRNRVGKPVVFTYTDLIAEFQPWQKVTLFEKYKEQIEEAQKNNYSKGGNDFADIKTLVTFQNDIVSNEKKQINADSIKPHELVIQEIFEAKTIAEGLLQIIENAVFHSKNGLLSMRIRCYEPDEANDDEESDTKYLKTQYFNYFKSMRGHKYYLEIKLSDINSLTMLEKFLMNVNERGNSNKEVRDWYDKYYETLSEFFKDEKIFLPFFDSYSSEINNTKKDIIQKYYDIPGNSIHHFGLQILDSIVTSSNGAFAVSGHGASYLSDKSCMIFSEKQLDTGTPGTSYKMLIPFLCTINGRRYIAENTIGMTSLSMSIPQKAEEILALDFSKIFISIRQYISTEDKSPIIKEKCIEDIAQAIITQTVHAPHCLVCDCLKFVEQKVITDISLELFIKGLLTAITPGNGYPEKMIPTAIINLSSYDFLEVVRLISSFYDKSGKSSKWADNIQIYILGREPGEEMLFSGKDLAQNAARLQKASISQGIKSEFWEIANNLLQRQTNN